MLFDLKIDATVLVPVNCASFYGCMDKKRIRRSRSVGCDVRLAVAVIKWVTAGSTLGFWVYFSSIVFYPSEKASRPLILQAWVPYQLSLHEASTGQLSQKSVYTGTYKYEMLNNAMNVNGLFRIHFPIEVNSKTDTNNMDNNFDSPWTCLFTNTGAKGFDTPNQDRSVVIADHSVDGDGGWSVVALFDGHGDFGHVTSHVAVTDLPSLILQSLLTQSSSKLVFEASPKRIAELMTKAFQKIDSTGVISKVPRGGSTAVVVLQHDSWVHIASVGDSTAVLVQWLNAGTPKGDHQSAPSPVPYKIIASAVKHKPGDPLERKRIEENGGQVYIPLNPSESSRVVFDVIDEDGRKTQTGLAMSRALGDTSGKHQNVVIADPDIVSIDLDEFISPTLNANNDERPKGHFFVIVASDGVTDMISLDLLIKKIGNTLYDHNSQYDLQKKQALDKSCRMIVNSATKAWNFATHSQYRDDISFGVHKIM